MSTQVQFRRGTTTQNNAFTGAVAELTYDTDVKTLRIHDGSTAGGGAVLVTTTATQGLLNKTLSTGSVWNGNAIALAYGGTGRVISTPIPGGIAYGVSNGIILSPQGTSGQVLISGGDSAPSWVASTSLQAGNSVNATYATNIAGGSAGQLLIQQDASLTTFITAGDAGTFLKSNGAGYAPGWASGQVTFGSTTVTFGGTSTSISGLTAIDGTTSATSFFATPSGSVALLGTAQTVTAFGGASSVILGNPTSATLTIRPGTVVGYNTTQNVFNTVATTINAFGEATSLSLGAATGTFTINNAALVHSSTAATKIAVGTTAQRPTAVTGQIRYNSDLSTFEGYGASAWGSLGGVKSVDGLTYIIAETSAGASNDELEFYASNNTTAVKVGGWNTTRLLEATGTVLGTQTTQNLFNTVATTLNLGGAATTVSIGAATGTLTVNNTTLAAKAITASTTLGVTGNTTIGGTLSVTGTSSHTGNATFAGTLGVTGATTLSSTLGVTGATTLSSTLGVTGDLSVNTNKFTVTAASGNTSVAGTLGVTGATTLSSTLGVTGATTISTLSATSGTFSSTLGVTGATTLSSTLGVTGVTSLTNSTASSSTSTGALVVTGGVGIGGNIYVGGNTVIAGNLSVTGSTTTTSSQSLTVTTPQLYLASDNTGNTTDVGLIGGYNPGAGHRHMGLVKSAANNEWRLFSGGTAEPGTTYDFTGVTYDTLRLGGVINTGNETISGTLGVTGATTLAGLSATTGSFSSTLGVTGATTLSTLSATSGTFSSTLGVTGLITATGGLSGNTSGTHTGAVVGNASTASALQTARTIALTGDATASGSFDGSANYSQVLTLAASGVTAGSYGSSTAVPVITVDAKGRITSASTAAISGSLTFTGDVTGTGSTGSSTALTLAASGVTAGTYSLASITVDAKGRITAASSGSASASTTAAYLTGRDAYTNGTDGWWRSNGNAGWYSATYNVGIYSTQNGWVTTYNSAQMMANGFQIASDRKIKDNIVDSKYGLNTVLQLRSVEYDKKVDGSHDVGLIAQEVEEVIPEFVHTDPEGMKTVNYPQMVSVLIKAVQELSAEVNALKAKLGE